MMKAQVDIVTGFLGSGKTTFIQSLLQSDLLAEERIAVIQCEAGEEEIGIDPADGRNISLDRVANGRLPDSAYIKGIIEKYLPDRIIIEHNGMQKVEDLLDTLEDSKVRKNCKLDRVIHLVESSTFEVYMNNMGSILTEQISNSDLIIANQIEEISRSKRDKMLKALGGINKHASVLSVALQEDFRLAVDQGAVFAKKAKPFSKPSDILFLVLFALIVPYFLYTVYRAISHEDIDWTGLQVFNTVFLSILIQAFPFILIGVLVSSLIQVFISQETIVKFFPKNKVAAFGVAVFSGLLFSVCDCAIVPVAGRLVKKGVPLPVAVTFMLAAPIVNPIVIASTVYAFPGQPAVAFYRVYLGIMIALFVGVMLMFFPKEESVLRDKMDSFACKCGCCSKDYGAKKGFFGRVDAIFTHAASEFFEVGRFLVVGAFLSTIVQTIIPKEALASLGGGNAISLLIMMASAFVLSICSTSDAFIARTFTSQFALGPVMGFLVLGPMVDIKNLLMLFGIFKKRFVIKLVFIIVTLSFVLLYIVTSLLF